MANRPDAIQSSRKSQCFSASVRTTWLYRPDTIQGLTSIRVSASRHSYGKTAATVWTMSSIREERAYQVQPSGRQPLWSGRSTLQGPDAPSSMVVISCSRSATVRTLGQHRPDAALLWKLSVLSWRGSYSWTFGRSVKPSGHPRVFWS